MSNEEVVIKILAENLATDAINQVSKSLEGLNKIVTSAKKGFDNIFSTLNKGKMNLLGVGFFFRQFGMEIRALFNPMDNLLGISYQMARLIGGEFADNLMGITARFMEFALTLLSNAAPAIEKLLVWVEKAFNWFESLDPEILKIIGTLVGFAVVLGPLVGNLGFFSMGLMSIFSVIGMLLGPVGGLVLAIVALGAAFLKIDLAPLFTFLNSVWDSFVEWVGKTDWASLWKNFTEYSVTVLGYVLDFLAHVWSDILKWFSDTDWSEVLGKVFDWTAEIATYIGQWLANVMTQFLSVDWVGIGWDIAVALWEGIGKTLSNLWNSFWEGGLKDVTATALSGNAYSEASQARIDAAANTINGARRNEEIRGTMMENIANGNFNGINPGAFGNFNNGANGITININNPAGASISTQDENGVVLQ